MRAALLALALAAGPGTILPPPTTTTTDPPVPSTTVTTARPTTSTTDAPSSTTTTGTAPSTTAGPTTTAPPRTTTTAPAETTTTEPGFVPPEGVAPGPDDGPPAPLRDAGTGALPLMVGLSIAGLVATATAMGVQWWRTRTS